MKRTVIILVPLVFLASLADALEKPSLAVLDFRANNISEADMRSIVSLLTASLFRTARYTVIDVGQRDALLREMDFSLSDCSDESCQLEIGRLLSAEFVVVGDIALVGTKYLLTAKILETETAKTVTIADGIYANTDALIEDLQSVASRLAALETETQVVVAEETVEEPSAPEGTPGTATPRDRPPLAPRRAVGIGAIVAGLGATGAGGWFIYDALRTKSGVVDPSYDRYLTATPDENLTLDERAAFFDGLWMEYESSLASFKTRAILGLALCGGGLALGALGVVLAVLPVQDRAPVAGLGLHVLPVSGGAAVLLTVRW